MKKDWVGEWFPILEKQGECVSITFGKLASGSNEVEWVELPHLNYDGIGGLTQLLRDEQIKVSKLPELRSPKHPSFFRYFLAILIYLKDSKRRGTQWKHFDSQKEGKSSGVAWHLFSESETKRLHSLAKSMGVTLNTLLLWALDRSVPPLWLKDARTEERLWLIPVNMRGAIVKEKDTANHASYIGVNIEEKNSISDINNKIIKSITKFEHWGSWWGLNLGRYIGIRGMKFVLSYYKNKNHQWFGTFSNLGSWPPIDKIDKEESDDVKNNSISKFQGWFICPPATRSHPISTGCVTWNGRLGIALQIHPVLTEDMSDVVKSCKIWVEKILANAKN